MIKAMPSSCESIGTSRVVGRYTIYGEIGGGGMATVHLGRLTGAAGFSRTVAIKRLYPQYAKDPDFSSMFLDEARLASRIHHPNVVSSLDVVSEDGALLLVMEYVHGETLAYLLRAADELGVHPTPAVVCSIISDALYGLHAAHTATSETGEPLNLIHRDISPQNVMVGADGVARVLDFGVAKAAMRSHSTSQGQIKGKLSYMSPEQLRGQPIDQRTDVFAIAVVLWEALAVRRLFKHDDMGQLVQRVLKGKITPPSRYNAAVPFELDAIVMRGLARNPKARYQTARNFAVALERLGNRASPREVGEWVNAVAARALRERSNKLADIETGSAQMAVLESTTPQPQSGPVEVARAPGSVSQVASMTATCRPGLRNQRSSRRKWSIAAIVVLLASLATVAVIHTRGTSGPPPVARSTEPVAAAQQRQASPSTDSPPATGSAKQDEQKVLDINDLATESAPKADTPATKTPSPSTRATTPPVQARHPVSSPAVSWKPPTTRKAGCDLPYRIDERGIRRIRPECL